MKIEMNSKKNPLWQVGHRTAAFSSLFRASNRLDDSKRNGESKAPGEKGSRISLSDFLNRKLHRSSVLPTSVEGKEVSSLSPSPSKVVKGESSKIVGRDVEKKSSIDGPLDINIFKNIEKGVDYNKHSESHSPNEIEIIDVDDLEQTRKRKCLFEDHDDKPTGRKRLLVLGDDSKPIRSSKRKKFPSEEQRPHFNHYENGGGWWNENMAGVDNEEVGCTDAWEGVGCTTLGGLDWN